MHNFGGVAQANSQTLSKLKLVGLAAASGAHPIEQEKASAPTLQRKKEKIRITMNFLLSACVFAAALAASSVATLQCYQCGQYNDGVGSITPCINETHMELKECPSLDHVYCIVSMWERCWELRT